MELPELADTSDLGQQEAAALLEEHDLTNVLNEIPSLAFTDLFGGMCICIIKFVVISYLKSPAKL